MMKQYSKNKNLSLPQAILFDTDNTLYEYHPANDAAEEAAFLKANNLLGINRKTFFKKYQQARIEVKKNLSNTASGHSRLLYFQRLIELLGFRTQLLVALDLEQTFWRTFLANAPLFSGVENLLSYLRKEKIPIGIVTDLTSQIQLRKLTYFGLEDTFDAVVTSEEIGADKPDKRNFELLLSKLNLPLSSNFWMIGDDPYSDIFGAKQLGAVTFQKIHNKVSLGKGEQSPDYSFKHFKDLQIFIENLVNKES